MQIRIGEGFVEENSYIEISNKGYDHDSYIDIVSFSDGKYVIVPGVNIDELSVALNAFIDIRRQMVDTDILHKDQSR